MRGSRCSRTLTARSTATPSRARRRPSPSRSPRAACSARARATGGAWIARDDGTDDDLTAGQHRKRRVGSGRALPVAFSRPALDGTLVVATDGLLGYAAPTRIAAAARGPDLETAAKELLRLVRLPNGGLQDDVAVVLARRAPRR